MNIDISNLDVAYLLGVYLTDGSIYKGLFRLNSIDRDFMERVADILYKLIGKRPNIREMIRRSKNHSPAWEMALTCHDLCDWLIAETNKKMKIPDFVFEQPLDWQKEFVAGLLDGDGFISVHFAELNKNTGNIRRSVRMGLCGLKNSYMLDVRRLFDKMGVKHSYRDDQRDRLQEFRYYNIRPVHFIEAGLYFRIERKVKKIREVKKYHIGLIQVRPETRPATPVD